MKKKKKSKGIKGNEKKQLQDKKKATKDIDDKKTRKLRAKRNLQAEKEVEEAKSKKAPKNAKKRHRYGMYLSRIFLLFFFSRQYRSHAFNAKTEKTG